MMMEWNLDELLGYCATWSAVKLYQESNGAGILDLLRKELKRHWQPGEKKPVDMHLTAYAYQVKE